MNCLVLGWAAVLLCQSPGEDLGEKLFLRSRWAASDAKSANLVHGSVPMLEQERPANGRRSRLSNLFSALPPSGITTRRPGRGDSDANAERERYGAFVSPTMPRAIKLGSVLNWSQHW